MSITRLKELPSLVAPILSSSPQIKLAYLIGSVSRDEERKDSDIDIVLIADTIKGISYGNLQSKFADILHSDAIDLRIVIPQETDPLFLFQILEDGKLLYKKGEGERVQFETYAMKMYYDTQHTRNIYNAYLEKRFSEKTFGK